MTRSGTSVPRLSARITLTFAVAALVVSASVALSAYLLAAHFLTQQQERAAQRLAYVNAEIALPRLAGDQVDVPTTLDSLTTGTTGSVVIYTTGRWYSSSLLISRDALPGPVRSAALDGEPVRTWTRIAGAPRIVVGLPLPAVSSTFFLVVDESGLSRTLAVLRAVLFSAASATTAAGALFGWRAGRRLTAPLRAVDSAARRLAAGDLDTRLPTERDAELAGLVTGFNEMADALQDRIERDARFAADVSHELRSPLTTLSASVSVLVARRAELSARSQEALDLLDGDLERFRRLVDDLLDMARAESEEILAHAEPLRMSQLVLNLLSAARYSAVEASFEGDALVAVVTGDKRRLEQALRNLLDNAQRHGGGATRIVANADAAHVTVAVDDDGPGIPAEEREAVFERFTRGRSVARGAQSGSGLGLALVRRYVTAHGGRVWAAESPTGGARLILELPRASG